MRRLPNNIEVVHKDKFYVYALFKPQEYYPFYVGKGLGNRVNDHFKPSNLTINTPKTGIIKKYGNSIRREILCYFDEEESAYSFEEYLISYYGLQSEGGCLVNYAKTRFQYSDKFVQDVSSKGYLSRKTKYTTDQILAIYDSYFRDRKSLNDIEIETGVPVNYLYYVVSGKKWKTLYKKYTGSTSFVNKRDEIDDMARWKAEDYKISDEVLMSAFEVVCSLSQTVEECAQSLGCSSLWLGKVFSGLKRKTLRLDYERYRNLPKGKAVLGKRSYEIFAKEYSKHFDIIKTAKETGLSRTSCYRYQKVFNRDGMESGLNDGVGDSNGSAGDNSISNAENT